VTAPLPPLRPLAIKERLSILFIERGQLDVLDGAFVVVDKIQATGSAASGRSELHQRRSSSDCRDPCRDRRGPLRLLGAQHGCRCDRDEFIEIPRSIGLDPANAVDGLRRALLAPSVKLKRSPVRR